MKNKNKNKGFSLVELIVVIAILAVLVVVIAPAFLQYVERSRAQKDDSAMAEVVRAVELSMSDPDVYDEVLYYSCYGNVSCYIDQYRDAMVSAYKVETKPANGTKAAQYNFSDGARQLDETIYYFAGHMRGMTITFQPQRGTAKTSFVLANAIINKCTVEELTKGVKISGTDTVAKDSLFYIDTALGAWRSYPHDDIVYVNATPDYANHGNLGTMSSNKLEDAYLYNRVRAIVGEEIKLTSQTYRNSEYTIFIRMDPTSSSTTFDVYGQWNGTNLTSVEAEVLDPN